MLEGKLTALSPPVIERGEYLIHADPVLSFKLTWRAGLRESLAGRAHPNLLRPWCPWQVGVMGLVSAQPPETFRGAQEVTGLAGADGLWEQGVHPQVSPFTQTTGQR